MPAHPVGTEPDQLTRHQELQPAIEGGVIDGVAGHPDGERRVAVDGAHAQTSTAAQALRLIVDHPVPAHLRGRERNAAHPIDRGHAKARAYGRKGVVAIGVRQQLADPLR